MNKIICLGFVVALLSGCSEKEPTYNQEYYIKHEDERLKKLDWCKGDAERKASFNCRNALDAKHVILRNKLLGEGIPAPKPRPLSDYQ